MKIMGGRKQKENTEPFPTKEPAKGSGIGMMLVSYGVEYHGGTLDMDSTLGEGTVFRMSFPLAVLS